jgi:hypothetical protein
MSSVDPENLEFFVEGICYKIHGSCELGKIVNTYCQQFSLNPIHVILQVQRTDKVFTAYDLERADSLLQPGDMVKRLWVFNQKA